IHTMLKNRKESLMARQPVSENCIEAGCDQPRMVSAKGVTLPRCQEHQREFWRDAAKVSKANRTGSDYTPRKRRSSQSATVADNGSSFQELERHVPPALRPADPPPAPVATTHASSVGADETD